MIVIRRRAVLIALATVALAALALSPAAGAKLAGDKVRLGVIMPMAGLFVDWGQHGLIGAEFARDEINAAGGVGGLPIELVVADDRGDPKESVTLTRRLAQTDRVLMIHGSISSSSAGVMFPLSASLKIPIITPTAAAPGLTDKFRPWAYTMNPGAAKALGTGLAALRKQNPSVKKATIIYNQADAISTAEATRVMPGTFQGAGIELLDSITFQTGDLDFSAQVTRALSKQPDMLFLGSGSRGGADREGSAQAGLQGAVPRRRGDGHTRPRHARRRRGRGLVHDDLRVERAPDPAGAGLRQEVPREVRGQAPQLVRPRDVRPALHLQDVRRDRRRHQQAGRLGSRSRQAREVLGGAQGFRRRHRRRHDERAPRERRARVGPHREAGRLHARRVAAPSHDRRPQLRAPGLALGRLGPGRGRSVSPDR